MEVKEALLKRRSVRKYTDEAVSFEDISELMHAAMSGPSASNRIPWEFFVITNDEVIAKLRKASVYSNIAAPLAIVVCGNLSKALSGDNAPFWIQDCSAATENILLRATDLGLGAVWCGAHPNKTVEKNVAGILGLSEELIPLNIIFVGHPLVTPEERDQYDDSAVHFVE